MGVSGLWTLLAPGGQNVPLEALSGQRVAVDVSVWLVSLASVTAGSAAGESVRTACLAGLFSRCCKLAFLGVRPVFVFDGPVPILKRRTVQARRAARMAAARDSERAKTRLWRIAEAKARSARAGTLTTGGTDLNAIDMELEQERQEKEEMKKIKQSFCEEFDAIGSEDSLGPAGGFTGIDSFNDEDSAGGFFLEEEDPVDKTKNETYLLHMMHNSVARQQMETTERLLEEYEMNPTNAMKTANDFSRAQMEAMRQKGALTQRLVQQRFKQYNTQRTDSHDGLLYRRVASDPRVEIAFKIGADSVQNKTDKASETPEQPAAENNSRNGVVVEASLNHPVSDEVKSFMETMMMNTTKVEDDNSHESSSSDSSSDSSSSSSDEDGENGAVPELDVPANDSSEKPIVISLDPNQSNWPGLSWKDLEAAVFGNNAPVQPADEMKKDEDTAAEIYEQQKPPMEKGELDSSIDRSFPEPVHNDEEVSEVSKDQDQEQPFLSEKQKGLDDKTADGSESIDELEVKREKDDSSEPAAAAAEDDDDEDDLILPFRHGPALDAMEEMHQRDEEAAFLDAISSAVQPKSAPVASLNDSTYDTTENELTEQAAKRPSVSLDYTIDLLSGGDNLAAFAGVVDQCRELLRLFGIPYITSPSEADCQCAQLELSGLVDGIISDDSDVFLFGAQNVYRHAFTVGKNMEYYSMADIQRKTSFDREDLISLALLLGADYTLGVTGVGVVHAVEILNCFEDLDQFHKWCTATDEERDSMQKTIAPSDIEKQRMLRTITGASKRFVFPSQEWPSLAVIEGYRHPLVNDSKEPFHWGKPDIDALRRFCFFQLGWSLERTEKALQPVIKQWSDANSSAEVRHPGEISQYFFVDPTNGSGSFTRFRSGTQVSDMQKVSHNVLKLMKNRAEAKTHLNNTNTKNDP